MADLQLLHLVARAASGAQPFHDRRACADLWKHLGKSFGLIACVLMPDHVHVLAELNPRSALRSFSRVLSAFRVRAQAATGIDFEWEPLPRPEKVQRDKRHIARTIRYIHLNPVRDALCDDPLEWEWSTHRDWAGAVAHPCIDRVRWGQAMGRTETMCPAWLHEYVSSDPSVRNPAPLVDPIPFLGAPPRDASIDALAGAVPRVLRSQCTALHKFGVVERRLFLLSAARWTRYRAPELARHAGVHPTSVRKTIRRAGEAADAALERPRTRPARLEAAELLAMALTLAEPRLSMAPRQRRAA